MKHFRIATLLIAILAIVNIAKAQTYPGYYPYLLYGLNAAGQPVPVSIDSGGNLITAAGAGYSFTPGTPAPRGWYPALMYGLNTNQPVPANVDTTGSLLTTGSGSGGAGTIVTRGLYAVYKVTDVTATTLPDSSGNNNNATLCSGTQKPSLVAGGLYFNSANNQCVIWPGGVGANVKTIEMFYKLVPPPTAAPGGAYAGLFCSTNSGGAQFISSGDSLSTNGGAGMPYIQNYSNARSSTPMPGVHLWDYYVGSNSSTDPDTVYQDGQPGTVTAAASASQMAAGTSYQTGYGCNANVSQSNLEGTVYYVLLYSVNLTQAEKLQNYYALAPQIAARGVNAYAQPQAASNNVFDCSGDSLTAGTGTGIPYCSYLSSTLNGGSGFTYNVYGMAGYSAQNMRAFAVGREILSFNRTAAKNIDNIWEGTNDMAAGLTASQVVGYIANHVAYDKTARTTKPPYVSAMSMISRTGQDANKNLLNTAERSDPTMMGADLFIDVAAVPLLGADGAYSNAACFQSDGIHLTVSCYTTVANLVAHSWNAYFGSNINNCDPTVVTAATYTGLDVDGCKQFDTSANSITYTLFAATGMTGRTIYACNVSTSGNNTLTLQAASGEYFNASGTTTLTVAVGQCQQLRSTLVSASAGGDYWRTGTNGNSVTVDGTQTITGPKTFNGGITTSTISNQGALTGKTRAVVAATDTATATDLTILCNAGSNSIAETLPSSPGSGQIIIFKKIDSSANTCTLGGGGLQIDGGTTVTLSSQWAIARVVYSNNAWYTF